MNKKFLNKVVGHIVKETIIDYDQEIIFTPFFLSFFPLFSPLFSLVSFTLHCKEIYSLNEQEIKYVYDEYRNTIKDKIKNEQ
jgi:hypothetical protein